MRFETLEIMRAVCAMTVFMNHLYAKTINLPQYPLLNMLFAFATEAVICFFVLSGCVIALQRYNTIQDYIIARIVRIAPIYYIALAVTVLCMIVCDQPINGKQIVANALFLQTMGGHLATPLAFNLPTWSLSYEAIYYALFVLVLIAPFCLWPLFIASVCSGISLYLFPGSSGALGFAQNIFSFFCFWLLGVIAVRGIRNFRYPSLETGTFLFLAGVCWSRIPLSSDYYDFSRLFGFAIGSGALCSALIAAEHNLGDSKRREFDINGHQRAVVCVSVVMMLWILSHSLFMTKLLFGLIMVGAALVPTAPVILFSVLIRPAKSALIYIAGLSYALYVIHYPVIYLINSLLISLNPIARVVVAASISLSAAHWLEYRLQRHVKTFLLAFGSAKTAQ